ncbi:MAG: putative PEP-binding protein, partial [Cyanobacteria bacterium P01_C01_bin.73]
LDQLLPTDRHWAGDKAISLGRLLIEGLPVLPGWVISADVFTDFLSHLNHQDSAFRDFPSSSLRLNVANPWQLQRVAQYMQSTIAQGELQLDCARLCQQVSTQPLILRPSLTARGMTNARFEEQMAGLLGSITCQAQPSAIAQAIKALWGRLFSAPSLLYWQRSRLPINEVRFAVLVQPLADAIAAGLAIATDSQVELQVVQGLGHSLVSGDAIPSRYRYQSAELQAHQPGHQSLIWQSAHTAGFTPISTASDHSLSVEEIAPEEAIPERTALNGLAIGGLISRTLSPAAVPSLTPSQQSRLRAVLALAQQQMGAPAQLEWLWGQDQPENPAQFWITQAYRHAAIADPYSSQPVAQAQEPTLGVKTDQTELARGLGVAPGEAAAAAIVLTTDAPDAAIVPRGRIIVAPMIYPDWLALVKHSAGLILEQGSVASHGAILARNLGIPAIAGVKGATQRLITGQVLAIDGDRGLIRSASRAQLAAPRLKRPALPPLPAGEPRFPSSPLSTQLMVTLSRPPAFETVRLPIDGVGLIRSELLLLPDLQGEHPQAWLRRGDRAALVDLLQRRLMAIARQFAPRPVRYRALDFRPREFQHLRGSPGSGLEEGMGVRGTFRIQQDPGLFLAELAAIAGAQRAGCHNLQLVLPFVRTVEEFQFCAERVAQAGLGEAASFQLWIMAEVPSVLFLLPDYLAAGVQGIAIGSNDLAQLMLGIDRDQPAFSALFSQGHPALMAAIAQIIRTAAQSG